ncbi:MAG TPA: hypothetical protein VHN14_34985 [Kofleriaceae bacterium]|nr:hypothetical protein [Kofleriaceae bacterium]
MSAAYDSLFHLIVDDAVRYLVPTASLRAAVARTFEHKDVKSAARTISEIQRGSVPWLASHVRLPISVDLASVCDTLVELHDQRHAADYDLSATFTRGVVNSKLAMAVSAHGNWSRERRSHKCAGIHARGRWTAGEAVEEHDTRRTMPGSRW